MKGDPLLRNLERDPRYPRVPEKNETPGGLRTHHLYSDNIATHNFHKEWLMLKWPSLWNDTIPP